MFFALNDNQLKCKVCRRFVEDYIGTFPSFFPAPRRHFVQWNLRRRTQQVELGSFSKREARKIHQTCVRHTPAYVFYPIYYKLFRSRYEWRRNAVITQQEYTKSFLFFWLYYNWAEKKSLKLKSQLNIKPRIYSQWFFSIFLLFDYLKKARLIRGIWLEVKGCERRWCIIQLIKEGEFYEFNPI